MTPLPQTSSVLSGTAEQLPLMFDLQGTPIYEDEIITVRYAGELRRGQVTTRREIVFNLDAPTPSGVLTINLGSMPSEQFVNDFRVVKESDHLQSFFQVDDQVSVIFAKDNVLNDCIVTAVRFTDYGKVLYDVDVVLPDLTRTSIVAVDSVFVAPRMFPQDVNGPVRVSGGVQGSGIPDSIL